MQDIAVVSSPDAPGQVSAVEFSSCMWNLAAIMKLADRPMPQILVMHVSDAVAARFGVERTGVIRHNRSSTATPLSYYEVWLVGAPDLCDYVSVLLGILEDHFLLDISSQERQRAVENAIWALAASDLREESVQ